MHLLGKFHHVHGMAIESKHDGIIFTPNAGAIARRLLARCFVRAQISVYYVSVPYAELGCFPPSALHRRVTCPTPSLSMKTVWRNNAETFADGQVGCWLGRFPQQSRCKQTRRRLVSDLTTRSDQPWLP